MEKGQICRIRDLSRALDTFSQLFESTFGISLTQAIILCQLREQTDIGPGELAAVLGLTGSHASKLIAQLEERHLIRRKLCREDKRCMRFSLTGEGHKKLSDIESAELPVPEMDEAFAAALFQQESDPVIRPAGRADE